MFIVFEGIDGSGKSTQIELCKQWLASIGKSAISCRDPGSTQAGDRIRDILLHRQDISLEAEAEMFLFMAARAQLVKEIIRPALSEGQIVLCDRFLLSTVVYQGHAGGLAPDEIRRIGATATANLCPDATIVLSLPTAIAVGRMGPQTDRMESKGLDFLERVREGFEEESQRDATVHLIDASGDESQVHDLVRAIVSPILDRGVAEA